MGMRTRTFLFRPPHLFDFGKMSNPPVYSHPPTIRESRVVELLAMLKYREDLSIQGYFLSYLCEK